jgi:hypothetical protein
MIGGLLAGLFVIMAVGPIGELAARVLPANDRPVSIVARERIDADFRTMRPGGIWRSYMKSELYELSLRFEDGGTRDVLVPGALYEKVPSITDAVLSESILLGIPVTFEARQEAREQQRIDLLMPIWGGLALSVFALGIAGAMLRLIIGCPGVDYPALVVVLLASVVVGGWMWF